MAAESTPPKLSAHELRSVSSIAVVHPTTVLRYLSGQRCQDEKAARIQGALVSLGLAAPTPLAQASIPEAR